jgi:Tfp pilus assembly protein FimT
MLVGLAIMALTMGIALPQLTAANRRLGMRIAVARLTNLLESVRSRAFGMNRHTGIRFTQMPDGWVYRVYEDGNGNGVSGADIAAGIDTLVDGPSSIDFHTGAARIGFAPEGVTDPDTGVPVPATASPVAFGTVGLCSFAPQEGATPGTIYLTDGDITAGIRCSPQGVVHTVWYDPKSGKWSSR